MYWGYEISELFTLPRAKTCKMANNFSYKLTCKATGFQ